jgi:hypothetical protein
MCERKKLDLCVSEVFGGNNEKSISRHAKNQQEIQQRKKLPFHHENIP